MLQQQHTKFSLRTAAVHENHKMNLHGDDKQQQNCSNLTADHKNF